MQKEVHQKHYSQQLQTVLEFNEYLLKKLEKNDARHNSMSKLSYAFFKYENKLEIS